MNAMPANTSPHINDPVHVHSGMGSITRKDGSDIVFTESINQSHRYQMVLVLIQRFHAPLNELALTF